MPQHIVDSSLFYFRDNLFAMNQCVDEELFHSPSLHFAFANLKICFLSLVLSRANNFVCFCLDSVISVRRRQLKVAAAAAFRLRENVIIQIISYSKADANR